MKIQGKSSLGVIFKEAGKRIYFLDSLRDESKRIRGKGGFESYKEIKDNEVISIEENYRIYGRLCPTYCNHTHPKYVFRYKLSWDDKYHFDDVCKCCCTSGSFKSTSLEEYIDTKILFKCEKCGIKFNYDISCNSLFKHLLNYYWICKGWTQEELDTEFKDEKNRDIKKKIIHIYKKYITPIIDKMDREINNEWDNLNYPPNIADIDDCRYAVERYDDFQYFLDHHLPYLYDPEYDDLTYSKVLGILEDYLEYINCYHKIENGDY